MQLSGSKANLKLPFATLSHHCLNNAVIHTEELMGSNYVYNRANTCPFYWTEPFLISNCDFIINTSKTKVSFSLSTISIILRGLENPLDDILSRNMYIEVSDVLFYMGHTWPLLFLITVNAYTVTIRIPILKRTLFSLRPLPFSKINHLSLFSFHIWRKTIDANHFYLYSIVTSFAIH